MILNEADDLEASLAARIQGKIKESKTKSGQTLIASKADAPTVTSDEE